uniref:WAP domain-containing protein n=1 Tax=Cyprinus carpio carpio TaxID=630221 RepID=A0A9J8BWZ5_CYPCA
TGGRMTARVYFSLIAVFIVSVWMPEHNSLGGFCPARLSSRAVPSRCSSDEDCPGGHKCCRFDCGPVCVLPVFSEFQLIMDARTKKIPHVRIEFNKF